MAIASIVIPAGQVQLTKSAGVFSGGATDGERQLRSGPEIYLTSEEGLWRGLGAARATVERHVMGADGDDGPGHGTLPYRFFPPNASRHIRYVSAPKVSGEAWLLA